MKIKFKVSIFCARYNSAFPKQLINLQNIQDIQTT